MISHSRCTDSAWIFSIHSLLTYATSFPSEEKILPVSQRQLEILMLLKPTQRQLELLKQTKIKEGVPGIETQTVVPCQDLDNLDEEVK